MSKNKGKPSQQKADERKELEASPTAARTIHRLDRSRGDEKNSKGETASRTARSVPRTQRSS
jgi:hypothetical protein